MGRYLFALVFIAGCNNDKPAQQPKDAGVEGLEKTVEKGPCKLTVRVSPKAPRLSDSITFELTVRADPEVEIKKPVFGKGVHEFTIRDYDALPEKLEDGKRVRRFRYKLEAEQAGRLLIRSQQIEYVDPRSPDKDGKRTFIASTPLEIDVTTEGGDKQPDLNDLAQMADPVPLDAGPLPKWAIALIAVVWLGLVALAVYLILYKKVLAKKQEIVPTPEEIARAELDALLKEKLDERGLFAEFYVRLTGIVRRYIERKTGIHAPEQTTEEFLHDPEMRRMFPAERAERLVQFLEAADMVKYAAVKPAQQELGRVG